MLCRPIVISRLLQLTPNIRVVRGSANALCLYNGIGPLLACIFLVATGTLDPSLPTHAPVYSFQVGHRAIISHERRRRTTMH